MFRRVSVIKKSDKSLRPATLPVLRRYAKSLDGASGLLHSMALAVCLRASSRVAFRRSSAAFLRQGHRNGRWVVRHLVEHKRCDFGYLFGGVSDRVGVGVCLLACHFFGFVDRGAITCRSGEFDLR